MHMWEEGVDVGRMEDWRIVVFNWDSTDVNLIHGESMKPTLLFVQQPVNCMYPGLGWQ